jgi:signal peptidase II
VKKPLHVLIIVTAVIVLDQITKYLVSTSISAFDSVEILPFLHIVNIQNTGAAFGMFKNLGSNVFIGVSVVAIIFIIVLIVKSTYSRFGLSLLLGGAIGNLIDRVRFGEVVDFIDVSVGKYHWPAFNVADSCLTIGIALILLITLIKKK